jgi:hypothetical protein
VVMSVQPAALANRQFIVLLVLQHYLLSDCPKLASMVSAWCLQVGADHTIYCALVHDRQHMVSHQLSPQAVCVCVNAAAAHTASSVRARVVQSGLTL